MSKLKLFPVLIDDTVPFICFAFGYSEKQVMSQINLDFPALKYIGDFEFLDPIDFGSGKTFVIDPDFMILESNDDIIAWTLEDDFIEDSDHISSQENKNNLLDDGFPPESEAKKDVKLLPEKAGESNGSNTGNSSSKNESGNKSENETEDNTPKVLWV